MNGAYQVLVSSSEILVAVGFVLLARGLHPLSRKIRIRSKEASVTEHAFHMGEAAEADEVLNALILCGRSADDPDGIKRVSTESGFLFNANLTEQCNIFSLRPRRIRISRRCLGKAERQIFSLAADSGILLAYLLCGGVEIINA
jgi:hypothetical protein